MMKHVHSQKGTCAPAAQRNANQDLFRNSSLLMGRAVFVCSLKQKRDDIDTYQHTADYCSQT